MKSRSLEQRQLKAIPILARSKSVKQGAKEAGITRTTYYNWIKDPEFRRTLTRERQKLFDEAMTKLQVLAPDAVETLERAMKDQDLNKARLASTTILNFCFKGKEAIDFEERLQKIEEILSIRT